ncbi:MAG TPA: sigma-54 dependent transcriptional regulator [candidate division Zixibacteria bacterium]|nr:sigma-54 dependent transcriptional regulator [candidate division Zixibacteria bacterium]
MEAPGDVILVVDDDADTCEALRDRLESLGYRVLTAAGGRECLELLDRHEPRLVLLDVMLPDMNGLEVLREIRRRESEAAVIMITAYATIERAVQAMKEGAFDFVPKPFEPDHIALIVAKALERETLKRGVAVLAEELDERHRMVVGRSPEMGRAVALARRAAPSKSTILLLGESGTGKEVFARAIHRWSERAGGPFVAINCAGLSRELLESELFGHEKGAFTGALHLKRGRIELAHGGTVFLDEVGDVAPEIQAKLLRFLQEREFERVGGTRPIGVDVRIIAATNRDLESAVRQGRFREDLFYRLSVVVIKLPPLRARKADIPELADYFLGRFAADMKKPFTRIAPEVLAKFQAYDWPGNVRELANIIERAMVLGQGPELAIPDLPPNFLAMVPPIGQSRFSYRTAVDEYRRELISRILAQTEGNRAAAARILGLQRTYLSRLIKSLRVS